MEQLRRRLHLGGLIAALLALPLSALAQGFPTPTFQSLVVQDFTQLGSWATGGRPAVPAVAMCGYNTTLAAMECWEGAAWVALQPNSGRSVGGGALFWGGVPAATLNRLFVVPYACTIPANLAGTFASYGHSLTAATGTSNFPFHYIHGVTDTSVGNISFAAAAKTPTFPTTVAISLVAGDSFYVASPASPDATLADVSLTIACQKP